jgi:DNA helicase-2/ATP-dependent DNA helicase PcrA
MVDKGVWDEERAYLTDTLTLMHEEMTEIDLKFKHGFSSADEASDESLRQSNKQRYRSLANSLDSPYFARIDFAARDEEKEKIYIGKTPVYTDDNIMVTDWRAPIASLYYDGSTGLTEYKSPKGRIQGVLTLKRQLTIAGRKLTNIEDIFERR